jgi:hypothetical protein
MKVKIKTWDKMEKEFGLNTNGNINCPCVFNKKLEADLPSDRIIEILQTDLPTDKIIEILQTDKNLYNWYVGNWGYWITDDMIEEVIEK